MRKKYRLLAAVAAAGVMLMAQPVQAAGAVTAYTASVIVAGGGDVQGPGGPGSMEGNAPSGAPPESPGLAGPGQAGPGAGAGQAGPGGSGMSFGGQGTVLTPVVTAGADGQAAGEAEGQQAGQEAEGQPEGQEAEGQQVSQEAEGQQAAQQAAQQAGARTIDPGRPMVALTFDDGPQPSVGNRIMDCLAQYGGKATFFMVGDRVAARQAELKRMVAEGHEVANHTMNHKYLQRLGAAEIQSQVTKCNDAIEAACGVRPSIMRLPGGNHNAAVLANTHMPMIQWNIDTLDWKTKNAQKTVEAVLSQVKDGDIILMHELYSQSGDAALTIIPELTGRGYQLVTVSEMAAAKGHTLQAGKLYSSFR